MLRLCTTNFNFDSSIADQLIVRFDLEVRIVQTNRSLGCYCEAGVHDFAGGQKKYGSCNKLDDAR